MDLARAFDTVNHRKLLDVMEDLGIRGVAGDLFRSYLEDRKQCVEVNGVVSEGQEVLTGVPQGTVLGPVLFLIYINEFLSLEVDAEISSFADDTVILFTGSTWEEVVDKAENGMEEMRNWLSEMDLMLNMEKTKCMVFSNRVSGLPRIQNLVLRNGSVIECIKSKTYLGVEFDEHLRWDLHIARVTKKLRSLLFTFRCLKRIMDDGILKILYHALVESHLQYGISSWGGAYKCHKTQLKVLQKTFLKIMYNKERTYPTQKLFEEVTMLELEKLYYFRVLCQQYKRKTELPSISHTHDTRHKKRSEYVTERAKKAVGQRSFYYMAARVFSLVPLHIRNVNSPTLYKKWLKIWLRGMSADEIDRITVNSG